MACAGLAGQEADVVILGGAEKLTGARLTGPTPGIFVHYRQREDCWRRQLLVAAAPTATCWLGRRLAELAAASVWPTGRPTR